MIKMIGAAFVMLGCAFVGIYMAASFSRELKQLHRLTSLLDLMSCELQYRMTPMPELCRIAAMEGKGPVETVFLDLSTELECQISPDVATCMNTVLGRHNDLMSITRDCLHQLGSTMGRFDLSGQLKAMEAMRKKCRAQIDVMNDGRENRLRSYRTLGVCAGAALVILLV